MRLSRQGRGAASLVLLALFGGCTDDSGSVPQVSLTWVGLTEQHALQPTAWLDDGGFIEAGSPSHPVAAQVRLSNRSKRETLYPAVARCDQAQVGIERHAEGGWQPWVIGSCGTGILQCNLPPGGTIDLIVPWPEFNGSIRYMLPVKFDPDGRFVSVYTDAIDTHQQ